MKINYEAGFVPYKADKKAGKGSALVFAPHPDDEVIGCAGAVIKHLEDHQAVNVVIATDGRLGDPELAGKIINKTVSEKQVQKYIDLRRAESRKAGRMLGYGDPEFWPVPDRTLTCDQEMIKKVVQQIHKKTPSCVYMPSIYEMHPDHRALAMIVLEAVTALSARPDLYMYEIGRPMLSPDILVDITNVWDRKKEAVHCFKSQLHVNSFQDYMHCLNRFRSFTLPADVKMAEAYMKIESKDFENRIDHIMASELLDRKGQVGSGL